MKFYQTPPHRCSYLPDRDAVTLFADPHANMDVAGYSRLAELGFRRSGSELYRPHCPDCSACVPVRVPVCEFQARRRERRILTRNQDLRVCSRDTTFRQVHFDLYARYLQARHQGAGMDQPTPEDYRRFLCSDWCTTEFVEFRRGDRLLAVAVTDVLAEGLSAVYTFFDPDQGARSLGTFTILWQINEAKRRGLPWLYLGYWIEECQKMRYKGHLRPLQALQGTHWTPLPPRAT